MEKLTDKIKQIILVRKDLKMRKGKIASQVAHASMKVLLDLMEHIPAKHVQVDSNGDVMLLHLYQFPHLEDWLLHKFTKIVVGVDSEEELLNLYNKIAATTDIPCSLIQDAGDTEFNGVPTYTTVAIGPDYSSKIDPYTGHLKPL